MNITFSPRMLAKTPTLKKKISAKLIGNNSLLKAINDLLLSNINISSSLMTSSNTLVESKAKDHRKQIFNP